MCKYCKFEEDSDRMIDKSGNNDIMSISDGHEAVELSLWRYVSKQGNVKESCLSMELVVKHEDYVSLYRKTKEVRIMYTKKVTITKENRFGDRYTIEDERLVYETEEERMEAAIYNRSHSDSYTEHYRKRMSSVMDVKMEQIMDSIHEYFDMLDMN